MRIDVLIVSLPKRCSSPLGQRISSDSTDWISASPKCCSQGRHPKWVPPQDGGGGAFRVRQRTRRSHDDGMAQIEDRRESWSADQQQKRQDLFHIFVSQWT